MAMALSKSKCRVAVVSFSGVDGAGKSTQIQVLASHFRHQGLRVAIIAFWDQIACLKSLRENAGHSIFKGEKGVGSPGTPVNRRDKNVRSWPILWVRLVLYLLDALSSRRAVRAVRRAGADFVIFDRYIYDELANLNLRNPLMRAYARLIMWIVPRPDVSYLLDADPLQARARKPEYPLEFIYLNRQSYYDLTSLIGGITVVPPMEINDVQREVLHHALGALSGSIVDRNAERVTMQRAN
jgi:thymidylate kinase